MGKAMKRERIIVNDHQLACARIASPKGQDYLKAMAAAKKGNQSCMFIGKTDAEAEAPILWPPGAKS